MALVIVLECVHGVVRVWWGHTVHSELHNTCNISVVIAGFKSCFLKRAGGEEGRGRVCVVGDGWAGNSGSVCRGLITLSLQVLTCSLSGSRVRYRIENG